MKRHNTDIHVRYAETDRMGVAHHSSYFLWFELGRTGLLKEAGFSYRNMEKGGIMLPVVECSCRYYRGADYDDLITIEAVVTKLQSRGITFSYRALRGDELMATGWTRHVSVDPDNTPKRLPPEILEAVSAFVTSSD